MIGKRKLIRKDGVITGWRPVGREAEGEDILLSNDPIFVELTERFEREMAEKMKQPDRMAEFEARIAELEAKIATK